MAKLQEKQNILLSARLRRIGNSTGVVIPKVLLEKAGIAEGSEVEIEATEGQLTISKKVGTEMDARRALNRSISRYDRAYRKLAD